MPSASPFLVMNRTARGEKVKSVQMGNIDAGKAVADVIRTSLGPRAMLKMLMDPMGGIVMTNDGNAILREITADHPVAKTLIEIARTQDEEVGDGTTSVIVLTGELLAASGRCLEKQIHPTKIIKALMMACDDILSSLRLDFSQLIDLSEDDNVYRVISSCIGTKIVNQYSKLGCKIAHDAVKTVYVETDGRKEIDIKRYAKVEKIPGGSINDSCVLDGVMFNKDITHPKMRRRIMCPRLLLLGCNLEYKKGESQTTMEIINQEDFTRALEIEEACIKKMCEDIIQYKPDVVITEKGISDLAQHYLSKAGISAIRRLRKTDMIRIAKAVNARIVNRTDEIKEDDIGTGAGLFEVKKIGDEYFTFITGCKDPKACTILLRGSSKDILNEIERNLQDAMNVTRNVMLKPYLVPGGGAVEMALSHMLAEKSKTVGSAAKQIVYLAVSEALQVIPWTLGRNAGADVLRLITELKARHAMDPSSYWTWGIDGITGKLVDMKESGVWDPLSVKEQVFKLAFESVCLVLRVDDVVSGAKKQSGDDPSVPTNG